MLRKKGSGGLLQVRGNGGEQTFNGYDSNRNDASGFANERQQKQRLLSPEHVVCSSDLDRLRTTSIERIAFKLPSNFKMCLLLKNECRVALMDLLQLEMDGSLPYKLITAIYCEDLMR